MEIGRVGSCYSNITGVHRLRQGEQHVKTQAEIRMKILHAKEGQRLPTNHRKLEKRHGTDASSQLSGGTNLSEPWTSSLQNCKTINFICLRQPVYSTLLWQLCKLIYHLNADDYRISNSNLQAPDHFGN